MLAKRWSFPEVDPELRAHLSRSLPCTPLFAELLVRRGVLDQASAARFLEPKLLHLEEPDALPDMERAVSRISAAIRGRERIAIFGDYDVDGISSTCLLLDFFALLETPVHFRLPHRLREGYGLRLETVRELAGLGTRLLITVDNGSSSREEVELARELGMDVVVVDHHQPSREPPEPVALVNPWVSEDGALFKELAGVGVTFKLVWALSQHFSRARKLSLPFRKFLLDSIGLVALGTIADVVPLRGENRIFARFGLPALQRSSRPGLRQLVELALRTSNASSAPARLEAQHIGFRLGPRLNAVGRLGCAELAIRLLRTDDEDEARRLIHTVERENDKRRQIEAAIVEEARRRIHAEYDLAVDRAIVLGDPSWHAGVLGIVAARLTEEFHRPAILFALDGDRGRGSARSVPGVHIHDALGRCREHLIQYGGHALAAGAEVHAASLPALREALNEAIDLSPSEMVPHVEVDGRLPLEAIGPDLLSELSLLSPHGEGNPEPLFAATGLEVVGEPRLMGEDGRHLSFHVRERGSRAAFRAVAFGMGKLYPRLERREDTLALLFRPRWNVWQGNRSIELDIKDLRLGAGEPREATAPDRPQGTA